MTDALIGAAVAALRAGNIVALPTETVYGLAADAANDAAVRRIFTVKNRPANHPLIVHVPDRDALVRYAAERDARADALTERFWPGPLTVIVRKSGLVSDVVTAGQPTVALRMIDHPLTSAILRDLGRAVAAPSANRFGRVSPTTAQHVRDDLGADVDLIVDGGPARVGVESTIVDLTATVPAVVRVGAIGARAIGDVLGTPIDVRTDGSIRASGTHASHYAPRAAVVLVEAHQRDAEAARRTARGEHVALLPLIRDPSAAARGLYAALRAFDAAGCDTILATLPPADERNAAVRDRLTRAAAPRGQRS
ncbi:MAG: L-threonylcarbamoyladenylate synthase [Candidatus Velthaea sp.]